VYFHVHRSTYYNGNGMIFLLIFYSFYTSPLTKSPPPGISGHMNKVHERKNKTRHLVYGLKCQFKARITDLWPIRARLAGQWDAGLKNISIIWISGRRRGGIVWVNPSSKCASCHSNEMHQRIIHTHVNVSSKAYVYDENIYNFCARARFPGCTYLRHIILGLNTVYAPCCQTLICSTAGDSKLGRSAVKFKQTDKQKHVLIRIDI
jgi:hypothetical protein